MVENVAFEQWTVRGITQLKHVYFLPAEQWLDVYSCAVCNDVHASADAKRWVVCADCQCARVSPVTLTLSRYILESSLVDYLFVGYRESLMAAACLLLAMYMNNDGVWVCLFYYSNNINVVTWLAKSIFVSPVWVWGSK